MTPDRPDHLRLPPLMRVAMRLLGLVELAISLHYRRRHPDLFTRAEAREYLRGATMSTLEAKDEQGMKALVGYRIGQHANLYHRVDLDRLVEQRCGLKREREKK